MQYSVVSDIIKYSPIDRLDTKLILAYVLNLSQSKLIINYNMIINKVTQNKIYKLIEQRYNRIPIHYLIGYREFYSRNFKVNKYTLIPRPETELLVEQVLKHSRNNDSILELGTGTGCIAITLKLEKKDLQITATDKYSNTLKVAKHNAEELKAKVTYVLSDWFQNINNKYNIIVANPPYIAVDDMHLAELIHEPKHALTDFNSGLSHIELIIKQSINYLLPNGYLLLEHGYNQKKEVQSLFAQAGFKDILTTKDYASLDRITLASI